MSVDAINKLPVSVCLKWFKKHCIGIKVVLIQSTCSISNSYGMRVLYYVTGYGVDDICVAKASSSLDMHVSYQQPRLPSAFSRRLSECDGGYVPSLMRLSKFTNAQVMGCN